MPVDAVGGCPPGRRRPHHREVQGRAERGPRPEQVQGRERSERSCTCRRPARQCEARPERADYPAVAGRIEEPIALAPAVRGSRARARVKLGRADVQRPGRDQGSSHASVTPARSGPVSPSAPTPLPGAGPLQQPRRQTALAGEAHRSRTGRRGRVRARRPGGVQGGRAACLEAQVAAPTAPSLVATGTISAPHWSDVGDDYHLRKRSIPDSLTPRFTRRAGPSEARTLQGRPQPARSGESSRSGQSEPALLLAPAPALSLRGRAGPPERRR